MFLRALSHPGSRRPRHRRRPAVDATHLVHGRSDFAIIDRKK